MYDHDYYATLDQAMVTLIAIALYLFMQLVRLCEYIEACFRMERDSQKETEIRFENLKQHGHI